MQIVQVLLTVFVIALMIFAVSKKFNATTTLLCIGLAILAVYTLITGTSVMGDKTSGSNFIDIFELVRTQFVTQLSSTGILIMSVMGFVYYMNHIKASNLLALLAARPLKKLKSPYVVVILAIVIAAILKLFIPSHSGLVTLLMATIFPIMIAAGVKRVTAASTIVLGSAFDLGPACPITGWAMTQEGFAQAGTIASFFVSYQIPITIIAAVIAAALFLFVSIRADKKDTSESINVETTDPHELGIPMFYAIFPTIPLILVLVFSELVMKSITISVVAANLMGFIFAFLINFIFTKTNRVQAFNDSQKYWDGMGNSFSNVVSLIAAASVFTAGLNLIGGTTVIINSLSLLGAGGIIVVIGAALIGFITSAVTGSGLAAIYTVAPLLPSAALASGMNMLAMLAPVITAGGVGRSISPVCAAVIIAASVSKLEVTDIVKRNMLPAIGACAAALISSFLLF